MIRAILDGVERSHQLETLLATKDPVVMGIINVTPDSFYDGGASETAIYNRVDAMTAAGVAIIDIGAESTRPGATPVPAHVERERLAAYLPHIMSRTTALISVDTYKPSVADYALSEGAVLINDISGGESPDMLATVARHGAGIVLMHKQGDIPTMQNNPVYADPIHDVYHYLKHRYAAATAAGIRSIIIDPGIGFGKTRAHNTAILQGLSALQSLKAPIMVGVSRKSFIGDITGAPAADRLPGTIAATTISYMNGARLFRVHDVAETIQALAVCQALR